MTDINLDGLNTPFTSNQISKRAQSVTKDGSKALALSYIDARDVMKRLDDVCGQAGWKDAYETHGSTTVCIISIKIDGEWVSKSDGAGDTDVEAEKGAMSDAFKRAAVKWGIGRHLYDMEAKWLPCECFKDQDGKLQLNNKGKPRFKKWIENQQQQFNQQHQNDDQPVSAAHQKRKLQEINDDLVDCHSEDAIKKCAAIWQTIAKNEGWSKEYKQEAANRFGAKRKELLEDHPFPEEAE